MPTLNISTSYANGSPLTKAQLDEIVDGVETFLNTTKIDQDNIATGGVATASLADNAVTTAKITDSNVTTAKINDLAVTTGKINDLAVTTGKLASSAVTTAKITDANVTADKIESNVNLNGTKVQAASLPIVVGGTTGLSTGLKIIRGLVTSSGTASTGEGFSSVKNSTGAYTVTFTSAFASAPIVVVTCYGAAQFAIVPSGSNPTTTTCAIQTYTDSGASSDSAFMFIAIGPR